MQKLLCVWVITVVFGGVGSTMAQEPLLQRGTKELGVSGNLDFQQESRVVLNLNGRFGYFPRALLLDSRVLRDQQLNERRKQRFASLTDVVHELEEPQVDREFLLGNAPMRT